ncbi:MAG: hypothetical protein IH959_06205 [Chloroflexi bacterium]|nr:hypothetical protein [Chloroflexota bacterium]
MEFDDVLLEPEQKELLVQIVEAARSVPRDKQEKFAWSDSASSSLLHHPGFPSKNISVYGGDLDTLEDKNLLRRPSRSPSSPMYDVTPEGYAYYVWLKEQAREPLVAIEEDVTGYLEDQHFKERHEQAVEKWLEARNLLLNTDTNTQLTTVGHLCRESMQFFATELVEYHKPPAVDPDIKHTVARVKSVLMQLAPKLGTTEEPFLEAVVAYWGTVADLIERQEHGAQKEGEALTWEDARRIVFHTAIVMFEVDRSLSRITA